MSSLLVALLGVMVATNQIAAASNLVAQTTGTSISVPDTNGVVEEEYQKLLADDNDAQAEVDRWIRENMEFQAKGAGTPNDELNQRIRERFAPIRKAYEDFIKRNPKQTRARVAFGSFLGDLGDEEGAQGQWEKALELDPKDPAIYNNLANVYGHNGSVKKAFEYYAKAIELSPFEPVYYHNFGTTVYLFRKDAMDFYNITEEQVFNKALDLYSKALKLDPQNFPLATDVAQTYYGIRPMRTDDALKAWTNTLSIAHDEIEREGVYIHFARIKYLSGRLAEARMHLNSVTNEMYAELKRRIARNLTEQENKSKPTNALPVVQLESPPSPPTKSGQ